MTERGVSERTTTERESADHAIARMQTGVTAFVGRTLKGPVNQPVAIASFAEYQRIFGGLWQPSTLSYAVEQFFENGGRRAVIVRVANGARPPTIDLPAGAGALRLTGVNPGSREYLRASVDYDGVADGEPDRFNLVVQRVRAPGSELVEDQEIFRRLSVTPGADRFVADALLESRLVRVAGPVPPQRPDRSVGPPGGSLVGYAHSNPDGDDGAPLTDYDVIGSATQHTGIFALRGAGEFDLLCIPPLSREQDVGLATLLVAARLCRERHAMLVVDPPADWSSPQAALEALRTWPFRSENAVMFYPRITAFDRLRGRPEVFASCGAAAGMLARVDESWPVWTPAEGEEPILRPGLKPATAVAEPERGRLAQAGVNCLASVRSGARTVSSLRTLAAGGSGGADGRYLAARRLALFVMACIERGTRWLLLEGNTPGAWERARRQVEAFLAGLDRDGAFAGATAEESYFVVCDERVNRPDTVAAGRINLLFGIALSRPAEFFACLVTHRPGSSQVRPVSVNRLVTSGQRVEWEIETAILKG